MKKIIGVFAIGFAALVGFTNYGGEKNNNDIEKTAIVATIEDTTTSTTATSTTSSTTTTTITSTTETTTVPETETVIITEIVEVPVYVEEEQIEEIEEIEETVVFEEEDIIIETPTFAEINGRSFTSTDAKELIEETFANYNIEENIEDNDIAEMTLIDYSVEFWDERYNAVPAWTYSTFLTEDTTIYFWFGGTVHRDFYNKTEYGLTHAYNIETVEFKFIVPISYDAETGAFNVENFKLAPECGGGYIEPSDRVQEIFSECLDPNNWI